MLRHLSARVYGFLAPRVGRFGFRPMLYTPSVAANSPWSLGWDDEAEIRKAVRRVADHTETSWERLAALWQEVRYLDRYGIPGALVECGVWRGGSIGLMALAHMASGTPTRTLHLFDSFQGLPPARAGVDADEDLTAVYDRAVSPEVACGLLNVLGYPRELVRVHAGWFADTVPAAEVEPIALLRLDGDWYDSTRVCLEHLEPAVVGHGVVVIDDYGHFTGCRRAVNEYIAKIGRPTLLHHLDYTGRVWVKAI